MTEYILQFIPKFKKTYCHLYNKKYHKILHNCEISKYIMEFNQPFLQHKSISTIWKSETKYIKNVRCASLALSVPFGVEKKVVFSCCTVAYVGIYCPMSALLLLRLNHKVTELTSGLLFDCFFNIYVYFLHIIYLTSFFVVM